MGCNNSRTIPGLEVRVDRVVYFDSAEKLTTARQHGFIYFITIHNKSAERVVLLGRKWIVREEDGSRSVLEGDKIVGKTPALGPGEHFSYNSFHTTSGGAWAEGSYHGVDDSGAPIHVCIPAFELKVPRPGPA